jgi:glucokinase
MKPWLHSVTAGTPTGEGSQTGPASRGAARCGGILWRMEIVAVDIGGTHTRFSLAHAELGNVRLSGDLVKLSTSAFDGLPSAWLAFRERAGRALPRHAAIAIASSVSGDELRLTNNSWVIRVPELRQQLQLDTFCLVNDFEAMAHAVGQAQAADLLHIAGPAGTWPITGVTTIIGPGTGLGVAQLLRAQGTPIVIATEGGHGSFAPLDDFEDQLLRRLRLQHERVSNERVVSGPGLTAIYETLCTVRGVSAAAIENVGLWNLALAGSDALASEALQRFCQCFGSVAGDIALAQGAGAVVIAGGVGQRLQPQLARSGFNARFVGKGRFRELMERMPVKLIQHPEPGLFGAAVAFAAHAG